MHELIRLLREFGADDALIALAEQFTATADDETARAEITDDDLDNLVAGLVALADDDEASAALLSEAVGVATDARGEVARRDEQAEADEAERAAAIEALRGEQATDDSDGNDGDDGGEGDEPSTDTAADTAADAATSDEGAEPAVDEVPEPVAAAGTPNRAARRALARRRPRAAAPAEPAAADTRPVIRFAADTGYAPGTETREFADVNRALVRRYQAFSRSKGRDGERIPVATVYREFPEERRLVDDRGRMLAPHVAAARVQSVIDEAIGRYRSGDLTPQVAAGGLCGPPQPIYHVPVLGEQSRPIRDSAMVGFQGARGALVSVAPPTLAALADAVSVWTVEDDEAALESDSVVKPCLRVTCGEDRTSEIAAIVRCLTIGNFVARTFSEWTDAWSELSMVAYDRLAEQRLFTQVTGFSTVVNLEATTLSATRDLLDLLSRLAWGIRSRNRVGRNFPVRVILPEIVHGVIRSDIARALPGGSFVENLALADGTIARFFAEQSLNVTWSPDLVITPTQAASTPAQDWPDTVPYAIYPEGAVLHIDAGELDLGVVRDSALNSVNDFQTFAEGFETAHHMGNDVYSGTVEVCPSGATSGTVDLSGLCGS